MSNLSKQTPKQRAHFAYMIDVMRRLEWDLHNTIEMTGRVPEAWHDIAAKRPESRTEKVNLRIEADVLRFFKSMGKGHGPRINAVLKSYMHARLAGVVRGAETTNHYRRRMEQHDGPKPRFGETAASVGQPWEDDPPEDATRLTEARMLEELQRQFADEGMPEEGTLRIK